MQLLLLVTILAAVYVGEGAEWSHHGEHGPEHWVEVNAQCSSVNPRQSPIALHPLSTLFEDDLTKITLTDHYSKYRQFSVTNSGHSVRIDFDHGVMVVGGGLPSKGYELAQLHFHWGSDDNQGSEHTVDGKRYPLEMHMVTYDRERYNTLGDAVNGEDSLAVLATMFLISEDDNPALEPLLDGLAALQEPGSNTEIASFPLKQLLPASTGKYFRYLGSLTTPPCAESVIWTLFLHTQRISSLQMQQFRKLTEGTTEDGSPIYLQDNYRPVQPIHKRVVYRSFIFKSEWSDVVKPEEASGDDPQSGATTRLAGVLTIFALLLTHIL